jgi:phosphoribosylformimino-5-aminoimidazole carboxamide ribotide isomerase
MQLLPVLDLKGGLVVRGVGGRRQEYQPVVSKLTSSALPLDVARAFREHFGLTRLYVADLDAIAGSQAALPIYTALQADGFSLWVDAGIRTAADAVPLQTAGVEGIIAGLETLSGPAALAELCQQVGKERVIFSLDLNAGEPLTSSAEWGNKEIWSIVQNATACGVQRLIVLDLVRVGVGGGTGTEELCRRLVREYPSLEVIAGGGIRDAEDLRRLEACGVQGALVASALHDGRLKP